jgi:hypothetical protein
MNIIMSFINSHNPGITFGVIFTGVIVSFVKEGIVSIIKRFFKSFTTKKKTPKQASSVSASNTNFVSYTYNNNPFIVIINVNIDRTYDNEDNDRIIK